MTTRALRTLRSLALVVSAASLVAFGAVPAGAQQLVDAGREGDGSGGLAFVIFAIVSMSIAASLFYMDRVRRRASDENESTTP